MYKTIFTSLLPVSLFLNACNLLPDKQQTDESAPTTSYTGIDSVVYESDQLIIRKISAHVYEHTSFLVTESFGTVPCNGMVVTDADEAVVFDTPANREATLALIDHFTNTLNCRIRAVVATHFHADCVAGLREFHQQQAVSYAHDRTIALLAGEPTVPQYGFADSLELAVGTKKVYATFFGEGHTADNCVGYFPDEAVLFGGCLIKETGAGKGYLGDANVLAWPETVAKIRKKYPLVRVVIPGHGKRGGPELLDYTVGLFE